MTQPAPKAKKCVHVWGIDGQHSNEFCKKCFVNKPHGQQDPIPNDQPGIWSLLSTDFENRVKLGKQRYGVELQPDNGRDALRDALDEAMDLCFYLRQAIYERDGA